jgi:hypothetical protein
MSPRHVKYEDKRWCWRHIQFDGSKDLDGGRMNFDRLHTPSGYVVIEDVIRFFDPRPEGEAAEQEVARPADGVRQEVQGGLQPMVSLRPASALSR